MLTKVKPPEGSICPDCVHLDADAAGLGACYLLRKHAEETNRMPVLGCLDFEKPTKQDTADSSQPSTAEAPSDVALTKES